MSQLRKHLALCLGLLAVLSYWYSSHPRDFGMFGYQEDYCYPELTRQLLAETIQDSGSVGFRSDHVMTPKGASVPFMSWNMERDWIGAYFWMWNPAFPFTWVYFGLSLLAAFFGAGFFMKKMKLSSAAAWGLAALAVVFHLPRHYKTFHHYEHTTQHWVYLSLFLDAWIWQRLWRERKFSVSLELWRAFLVLGMTGTAGYFWGPMILEWTLVRVGMTAVFLIFSKSSKAKPKLELKFEWNLRSALWPVFAIIAYLPFIAHWYVPLEAEVRAAGEVGNPLAWFTSPWNLIRPLWLEPLKSWLQLPPLNAAETVVTIGWLYWVPALLGLFLLIRKNRLRGLVTSAPFIVLAVLMLMYTRYGWPYFLHGVLRKTVPFMSYFRAVSRMGLFLPELFTVLIVLSWPELSAWARSGWGSSFRKAPVFRLAIFLFLGLSAVELSTLLHPFDLMPPLDRSVVTLLSQERDAPGTAILDLPFCVAGGNGMCTPWECPNYWHSTATQCFRTIHRKKIYGLYQGRMTEAHCQLYQEKPYTTWFQAWGAGSPQRCFNNVDWLEFCDYLAAHPELAAVNLYPEIWTAAAAPQCLNDFVTHLGAPLGTAAFAPLLGDGTHENERYRILRFSPKCIATAHN